mgnify:CR=1 FL=1
MNILARILEKRGIKDAKELDTDEREAFEGYQRTLSKPDITIENVKEFLHIQLQVIEGKWKSYDMQNKADLIPYHTVYKVLLDILNSPQAEREQLEKYLIQLHNL